ncbi:MAG: heavy metal-associated domain-containing protein [Bacteroidales bacterium]
MDCESCVNTIMKNIPFEKGVKDVKCDLTTKEVTVQYQRIRPPPKPSGGQLRNLATPQRR